ncbi:hypothetical protein D0962_08715 [Leptolyngbyaceae cyanobacterium CCMR0082]|uniref:Uncharacterized protein n=1 Tax=Adonisia turfae CCMR0082 TaxID=2304604 RepID=A0A6M0S4S4_9CYAN|nr:hypothetical protein [Adonisia turfae CCMR0082]
MALITAGTLQKIAGKIKLLNNYLIGTVNLSCVMTILRGCDGFYTVYFQDAETPMSTALRIQDCIYQSWGILIFTCGF